MAEFGKLNFSVSFNPTSGFPIDARYYFDTLAAAQEAAAAAVEVGSSDGTYFYGMNLVVVESGEATMYVIQPNKTLKAVGTTPVGDNKSIVVGADGIIALKGIQDAETGMYPAVAADGTIEWKAFDTTTTDGLTESVNQLKGQMTAAEGEIDALQAAVGNASSGLVKQVNDLSTNLTTNYYDKEAVDGLISGAFHFKGAADSYDGTDIIIDSQPVTGMKTGDVYQVGDKEYVYDGTKWIELGFNIDLSNYALKTYVDTAVSGAKTELQGYADQAEADALQAAKTYADTQDATTLASAKSYTDTEIDVLTDPSTGILQQAKEYTDTGLAGKANSSHTHTMANVTDAGALATKDQVAEGDLESTLAAKINAKADTSALTALQGEVDTLEGTVATKANASEVYTKGEADGKIAAAVAGASHLKRTIVAALPDVGSADENTIYMVAKSGDPGVQDAYDEYFVIEGQWEKIGDTVVDLTEYAKTTEVTSAINAAKGELQTEIDSKVDSVAGSRLMTDTEGTKLAGIEEGAQVNVIESITAGGEAIAPSGKAVALPLATAAKVGLVKVDNDSIAVTGDGTISVSKVNINKLEQTEGDVLILNGGNSVKS